MTNHQPGDRFTTAELKFIGARVEQYVRDNPSTEPLLTERKRTPVETCKRGHAALVLRSDGKRYCVECGRLRKRRARREGVAR